MHHFKDVLVLYLYLEVHLFAQLFQVLYHLVQGAGGPGGVSQHGHDKIAARDMLVDIFYVYSAFIEEVGDFRHDAFAVLADDDDEYRVLFHSYILLIFERIIKIAAILVFHELKSYNYSIIEKEP